MNISIIQIHYHSFIYVIFLIHEEEIYNYANTVYKKTSATANLGHIFILRVLSVMYC